MMTLDEQEFIDAPVLLYPPAVETTSPPAGMRG